MAVNAVSSQCGLAQSHSRTQHTAYRVEAMVLFFLAISALKNSAFSAFWMLHGAFFCFLVLFSAFFCFLVLFSAFFFV